MKKIYLFLLFGLLLAACAKDDDKQPILVTDIVMPAAGTVFNPGDKVTIKAQGFQTDDEIMLNSRWPMAEAPNGESYWMGETGIVTERTASSITFLAPGSRPAATVEVVLRRSGEMMTLGKISVADGQAPKEPQLYGITNTYSETGHSNSIDHIDLTTGSATEVTQLTDNPDFSCVVTAPGIWALFGIQTKDGNRSIFRFDLSMRYWREVERTSIVTLGTLGNENIITVCHDTNDKSSLLVTTLNTQVYTRDNYTPKVLRYKLPDGMKPEALSHYPCVPGEGYLLLSADNGNGTFTPVALEIREGGKNIHIGDPIEAARLIPFWTVMPVEDAGTTKYIPTTGCAVVRADNGQTELRLLDTTTMTLKEAFATFPNSARSITTLAKGINTRKLYVLFDTNRGGRLIYDYDMKTEEWQPLPGIGYPYSEIALTW